MIEGVLIPFILDDDAVLEVRTGHRQWRHDTSKLNNYIIINSTDYSECSSENSDLPEYTDCFLAQQRFENSWQMCMNGGGGGVLVSEVCISKFLQ